MMKVARRWAAAMACAAGAALPAGAMNAQGWTLLDLGTLGGPGSYGAAISDNGTVVGCADVGPAAAHAFIYRDGVMRDLSPGDASGTSCALAVNDQGVAAGRSASGELVTWNGALVTGLGVQGSIGGINDSGTVVGTVTQGGSSRAFVYANGVLGLIGGDASEAAAINGGGDIAGTSNGRAFLSRNGSLVDLGTLGGARSQAKGLNDRGAVVGMSTDANGQPLSFLHDGSMSALPAPGYSSAVAVNNRGQVVGSAEGTYGFLIDNGTLVRLDSLQGVAMKGWRHLEPTGINERGWIVGTGTHPDGNLRAFILVPGTEEVAVKLTSDARRGSRPGF
ncbi:MAG: hypothetical protein ACXWHB_14920 [Usitatibacter sp.]